MPFDKYINKMFLENSQFTRNKKGSIEVICGSMFSGKTEELIRRLKRAEFAKQKVEIFKPKVDTRYDEQQVVSHDNNSIRSTPIETSSTLLIYPNDVDVVGIDEAQFFDDGLIKVCNTLANNQVRVIVAGLDTDYKGNPFGPMPGLLAIADHVSKVHAVCVKCGDIANHTHRKVDGEELVMLGEMDNYEPLCRICYNKM